LSASEVSDPTVTPQNTPVPQAPAPTAETASAPPSTGGPENANGKGRVVADTTTTTTPADSPDVVGTVKTITPPAAQPGLERAIAVKQSSPTAPSTHTAAPSTSNDTKAVTGKPVTGKAGGNQGRTTSDNAAPTQAHTAAD
jgi:hypothetical protein